MEDRMRTGQTGNVIGNMMQGGQKATVIFFSVSVLAPFFGRTSRTNMQAANPFALAHSLSASQRPQP